MISWEGLVITMDRFVVTRVRFVITTEGVCLQHKVGDYNRGFVTTTEVLGIQDACDHNRRYVNTLGGL